LQSQGRALWRKRALCARPVLDRNEKDFLAVLDEALGSNYRVFVQVRLAELVEVKCGVATKRQAALNKVLGKRGLRYLLCGAWEPVAVIEVDDPLASLFGRKARTSSSIEYSRK